MSSMPTAANAAAKALQLEYTAAAHECHRMAMDQIHQVVVIGDLCDGCYEWVIEADGTVRAHSNCGYGDVSIALRDGLIAFHGLGDVTEPVELRKKYCY